MKITLNSTRTRLITATLALSILGNPAHAKEPQPVKDPSLTEQASEYVRDYLSDNRRAGSLAGSILGGALFAHPFGPVLGSLVGFMIGKQTMFNTEKTTQDKPQQLAQRNIAPERGQGQSLPTLSFSDPQGLTFNTSAPANTAMTVTPGGGPTQGLTPEQIPIPMAVPTISREQIATMCGCCRVHLDPRLRSLCFYFQGSLDSKQVAAAPNNLTVAAKP